MTSEERKQKISALERRKKGFMQNRSITAVVFALILYDTIKAGREDNPAWYFYLIMGIMLACLVFIAIRGTLATKKADKELNELVEEEKAEKEKEEQITAADETENAGESEN